MPPFPNYFSSIAISVFDKQPVDRRGKHFFLVLDMDRREEAGRRSPRQTPTLNLACTPFVRDIVARYDKCARYVADLVMLEATLRQPSAGRRTDLVAKYPLETLVTRNELATGCAITRAELTYVRRAAERLDVQRLSKRSYRGPQAFIGLLR